MLLSIASANRSAAQTSAFVLALALSSAQPSSVSANSATSQIAGETANEALTPPDVMTGPDFRLLTRMMRNNLTRCGVPGTAVVHWHVLPDGVIDQFVLFKSSGNACFDEVVVLNAAAVVHAGLRITPAMRGGVPAAGWVPLSLAARD